MAAINYAGDKLINERIFLLNTKRVFYFILVAIPVSLVHMLVFYSKLGEPGTTMYVWRMGIITSHALIVLTGLFVGLTTWFFKTKGIPKQSLSRTIVYAGFVCMIAAGVALTGFDQMVTPAITPFLIICLIMALIFIFHPLHALGFYLLAYVLFYIAMHKFQDDPAIILSNLVNGLTVVGIGYFLSVIMWQNTTERIKQSIIIDAQKEDLERRNKELTIQSDRLEHAIFTRDRFLSIISHDLKTPFNALMGFSEILLEDWDEMEENEKIDIIRLIKDTSETTYQLLLNLLDWSRIQKEQMKVRPEKIDFNKLTENVVAQLHAQANLKEVYVEVKIDQHLILEADEHMITSLLRNLLSNAIKFSSEGDRITINAFFYQDDLFCHVEDQGIGIPDEQVDHIFSDKITTSGTNHEQGTGLGLQLCQEYVRLHRGNIWVKSKINEGSVFSFRIPQSFSS